MASSKTFRFVPEGCGGTFTHNLESEKTSEKNEFIGTDGTETCVSVFFPVDQGRCFFAHIFVFLRSKDQISSYTTDPTKGSEIHDAIKASLISESAKEVWSYTKQQMREGLIMVCPHELNTSDQAKQTGYYAVRALQGFLEFPAADELKAEADSRGFIASIRNGLEEYIAHHPLTHSDVAPPTAGTWKEAEEPLQTKETWKFGLRVDTWAELVQD